MIHINCNTEEEVNIIKEKFKEYKVIVKQQNFIPHYFIIIEVKGVEKHK